MFQILIEDEWHFNINCPLYMEELKVLFDFCREDCKQFNSLTDKQKFIFIFTNETSYMLCPDETDQYHRELEQLLKF